MSFITVVEQPRTTAFTTLARVKQEFRITDNSNDQELSDLIEEVSSAVREYCNQPLIRQTVTERQVGQGRRYQMMTVTPVPFSGLLAVRLRDAPVSGCSVVDERPGFIVKRRDLYENTKSYDVWIEVEEANRQGFLEYEFDYTGGYILPGDDIIAAASGTIAATDDSFIITDDSTTFPILVAGEYITVRGFVTPSNNGKFRVQSRTPDAILVGGLTPESGASVSVLSRNLPRDLEGLVILEVKYRYFSRFRDPSVSAEKLDDWSANYVVPGNSRIEPTNGFLPTVAHGLERYLRVV
jgi:hypothetical protein